MPGCLDGITVIELGGKGPVPFAGMVLADMGAHVVRLDRPGSTHDREGVDVLARGKDLVQIDLKSTTARELLLDAAATVDVVIEGFRPGVAERLGLSPADLDRRNPGLVYGRLSGYGQDNAYSLVAGHDVNFVAMGSALGHMGPAQAPPAPPLNLVADFGGGGMVLALGVLAALVERTSSGRGQVVDAAMTDAVTMLMTGLYGMRAGGQWNGDRGHNMLDGSAPFYRAYETADGSYVSIGALEPTHWAEVLRVCGLDDGTAGEQYDRDRWPNVSARIAEVFLTAGRDAWIERFAGVDASFAPVLTMDDAPDHPYHRARGTFVEVGGVRQPGPAPRFSRTPSAAVESALDAAALSTILTGWGVGPERASALVKDGVVSAGRSGQAPLAPPSTK